MSGNQISMCCSNSSSKDRSHHSERLAAICKAMAHPVRIQILAHLKHLDHCICGQLVDVLPLAQSTVSQHLKILKTAGLVKGRIEGPCTCYCIDHDTLKELESLITAI